MFRQAALRSDLAVVGISRNAVALEQLSHDCGLDGGEDFELFAHDLTDPDLPDALLERLKGYGRVDLLINNAGYLVNKPFEQITEADWTACYRTNVWGPYRLIQQLYGFLEASGVAHIVNIGSMGGVQGSAKFPGLSVYSSSKMALVGLTECLAEEFKDTSVRINTVNLGAVQTEMLAEAFPGFEAPHRPEEIAEWILGFGLTAGTLMNGKSVNLSDSTP